MTSFRRFFPRYQAQFIGSMALIAGLFFEGAWSQPLPSPAKPLVSSQASANSLGNRSSTDFNGGATIPPPESKTIEVNTAAKIALLEGDVTVTAARNHRRNIKIGDALVEGDFIVTGKDGELHLNMEDGGYMAIRPNTRIKIVKYQAYGNDSDTGIFLLLEGSFRSITGWIGKFNREKYIVNTPNAAIGIYGTDHEPFVIPAGATGGEAGTYDKVNAGGSMITTLKGRAEIAPDQTGFAANDGTTAPRLLKDVPNFFRATRNEYLLNGKHDAVQQVIAQRRAAVQAARKKIKQAPKPRPPHHANLEEASRRLVASGETGV